MRSLSKSRDRIFCVVFLNFAINMLKNALFAAIVLKNHDK
jgi:hypothetical protein